MFLFTQAMQINYTNNCLICYIRANFLIYLTYIFYDE